MCVVSNIGGWGQRQYPQFDRPYPIAVPQSPPLTPLQEKEKWDAFLRLIEKGKEVDRRTNQPDCEAPDKAAFLERIEKRLDAIEAELGLSPREPEDLSKRSTQDLLAEIQRRIGSKVELVEADADR